MWYVYFLKSQVKKNWVYVGSTNNLNRRLKEHQAGESLATRPYLPLYIDAFIGVYTEQKARELEKYLKVGSGKAILKKRILTDEAPSLLGA
ncbi:MAG: GIY-YIG nuclease family protein [Patescibacteria group bacterium]|jgi:putative endonuclease